MIVAVTGLDREARVVARPGIITVVGGGNGRALETRIEAALDAGARRILSIGICGALSPALRVGDCVVATEIVTETERLQTDAAWRDELAAEVPRARLGSLVGSDTIVADQEGKSRLYRATNAAAVDMESHVAARMAQRHGRPFAALRVVSDSSIQSLPPAALVAMAQSGKNDVLAVLRSLLAHPGQIPPLVRTAWESERAFRALFRCSHFLKPVSFPGLLQADIGKLSLDLALEDQFG